MEKRKLNKTEKIALAIIAVLIVAAIVVGAVLIIGNTNKANEEIQNSEHTTAEIITEAPTATETNADLTEKKADDNTETDTTSKTTSANETSAEKSGNDSTEAKSTTSKTTSATKETVNTTNRIKPEKVVPETNKTHKSDNVCTINGTKCYVGDTITVAINLKTPAVLENYQGYTEYDRGYLEYLSLNMTSGGIYNEKDGTILYNASVLAGIDFTSEGSIYTATFKVKKAGSTQIKNTIQILTDLNDKPVSLGDCKEEIKVYN